MISAKLTDRVIICWDRMTIVFIVLAVMIGLYSVIGIMIRPRGVLPSVDFHKESEGLVYASTGIQEVLSFDAYVSAFSGRNIFQGLEEMGNEIWDGASAEEISNFGWGTHYKLVGVIVDKASRAVVKVRNSRDVHFLSVGQSLGEAVLKKVEQNRVWFLYQGQQVQLKFEGQGR